MTRISSPRGVFFSQRRAIVVIRVVPTCLYRIRGRVLQTKNKMYLGRKKLGLGTPDLEKKIGIRVYHTNIVDGTKAE